MSWAIKDKSKLNLGIDLIMFLLMMPIAGIGILIKYVLIPGYERNLIYDANTDLSFWGLTRHQWGSIHFAFSIALMILLVLHLFLHWRMIVGTFRKMIPNRSMRTVSAMLITFSAVILISFPLLVTPEMSQKEALHRNGKHPVGVEHASDVNRKMIQNDSAQMVHQTKRDNESIHKEGKAHAGTDENYEIYGSLTLQFVAEKYSVPVSVIAADIKVPASKAGERLGRLKKNYLFTMDDVRECIIAYKKNHP